MHYALSVPVTPVERLVNCKFGHSENIGRDLVPRNLDGWCYKSRRDCIWSHLMRQAQEQTSHESENQSEMKSRGLWGHF
jgi:hypothetical protein